MNTSKKLISVALSAVTVVMMSGAFLAPVASAQTTDVASQIAALMAQIQALQSQLNAAKGVSTVASYNYTRSLTVGSKGDDVTALQNMLIAAGDLKVAATGYFGPLTKAALAAWQSANNVSPASGYFGPITRAKVASMAAASTTTGTTPGTTPGTTTGTTGTTVTPAASGLTISVASDNPAAQNIPIDPSSGAEIVPVLKLNFAAGANSVTVTGLNVNRSGLSSDQDLQNVFLMDGNVVVATNLGISNGVITFSNGSGLFTVNANATKEITVAIEIVEGASAAGHTYALSVASASAITSNASSVGGSFPISGNTMTGTSVSQLGALQIQLVSTATSSNSSVSVNAGQKNYLVGQFNMTAQNQSVQVKSIKLTQTGSVAASDVANYSLYNGGTLVSSIAAINGQNVTFDLSANPLQLSSGQTDQMYVYTDVLSGVGRYFQLSVQHNYDIIANDMMFNFGILPYLSGSSFPMNMSYVNVLQGTLTVSRDANSPTNYALPGGTNQTLAKIDLTANGEAVRITGLTLSLPTSSMTAGNVSNVKMVDDQGQQIGTTQTTWTTYAPTSLNYIIPANTTRVVSIIADLSSAAAGNLQAGLSSIIAQGYTSFGNASVTATTNGNILTLNSTMLSVVVNNAMGGTTVVNGQPNAKIASFALIAGAASNVTVSNITLTLNSSTTVDTSFQNLKMMVGATPIGQTYSNLTHGTAYVFNSSSPISVAAGQQVIVDVYADSITGGAWSSGNPVTLTSISASAVSTSQVISGLSSLSVAGQTITLSSAGTLTSSIGPSVSSQYVSMGYTSAVLGNYYLTANNAEDINVIQVNVSATSTSASDLSDVKLYNGQTQVGPTLSLTGTTSSLSFNIPSGILKVAKNQQTTLSVVGDINTYGNASSSDTVNVALGSIQYQGLASSHVATTSNSVASPATYTIYRTNLQPSAPATLTSGSLSSTLTDGIVVGEFDFNNAANAGNFNATLKSITLKLGGSFSTASSSDTATISIAGSDNPSNVLATTTLSTTTPVTITLGTSTTGYWSIPVGAKSYLTITMTSHSYNGPAITTTANQTLQLKLTGMTWNDGVVDVTSIDPSVPATNYNSGQTSVFTSGS